MAFAERNSRRYPLLAKGRDRRCASCAPQPNPFAAPAAQPYETGERCRIAYYSAEDLAVKSPAIRKQIRGVANRLPRS